MRSERKIPDWLQTRDAEEVPTVLLPYQQRWIEDESEVKVCQKSRRVGLSWCEAADDVLIAAGEDGDDIWYIGYNKDMALEFIDDCAFWARHFNQAASEMEEEVLKDEDKDILSFKIKFPSGCKITALSSRPTNLRGKQGIVVIDEAAFHDNLDELVKAAIALLMWGGKVRIISTHNGDHNAFNELITEILAGKFPYSVHRITFDDALGEGLFKRISLVTKKKWSMEAEQAWRQKMIDFYGDHADEELFCIPSQGTGVYLTRAMIERCMRDDIPVLRFRCDDDFVTLPDEFRQAEAKGWCEDNLAPLLATLDPNLRHYFGEDFARSGDLTVITPGTEMPDLTMRLPFLLELRNVPFKEQELILFYTLDRLPRFLGGAMDARGNGQYLAEVTMQKYGVGRILQVMPTQDWYRNNMPRLKAGFEDQTLEIPKHADVLTDLRAVKMDKGVPKVPDNAKSKGTDGGQRHGDSAIALAMLQFAVQEAAGYEMEYQTAGPRRMSAVSGAW